jgi:carboxymethylenebutenolidase
MKRTTFAIAALLFCILPASAQDWAKQTLDKSPRHRDWVTIKVGDRPLTVFVVYPEVKDKAPAVVVIHEIFGLSDWAQTVADKLAANGYIAIAPDLLTGMGPNGGGTSSFASVRDVTQAIRKLAPDEITADLNAVTDYVKKLPSANGKVAVAGFCWGGGESFRFATNRKDLSAAFVFYGTPPVDLAAINAPVYGFYGEMDNRVTSTVVPTTDAMKAAGKKYDPVIYAGAGHGFMRTGEDPTPTNMATPTYGANVKAHDEAWRRWLTLLKENM